jgi:hypothetical protein
MATVLSDGLLSIDVERVAFTSERTTSAEKTLQNQIAVRLCGRVVRSTCTGLVLLPCAVDFHLDPESLSIVEGGGPVVGALFNVPPYEESPQPSLGARVACDAQFIEHVQGLARLSLTTRLAPFTVSLRVTGLPLDWRPPFPKALFISEASVHAGAHHAAPGAA